ncbi:hypothetical protein [Curtobacterium sp. PvP017]
MPDVGPLRKKPPLTAVTLSLAAAAVASASVENDLALTLSVPSDRGTNALNVDPFLKTSLACDDAAVVAELGAAVAGAAPKDSPDTMVAATSPAAPMDLKAVEALFL